MGDNKHDNCPCEAVEQLIQLVNQHEDRLDKHDERLERGNVDFAVINTKLNIVMAVMAAIGVAICGAVVGLIL